VVIRELDYKRKWTHLCSSRPRKMDIESRDKVNIPTVPLSFWDLRQATERRHDSVAISIFE
jgi:hypothetical protein